MAKGRPRGSVWRCFPTRLADHTRPESPLPGEAAAAAIPGQSARRTSQLSSDHEASTAVSCVPTVTAGDTAVPSPAACPSLAGLCAVLAQDGMSACPNC